VSWLQADAQNVSLRPAILRPSLQNGVFAHVKQSAVPVIHLTAQRTPPAPGRPAGSATTPEIHQCAQWWILRLLDKLGAEKYQLVA
jgi:hypothetical protein